MSGITEKARAFYLIVLILFLISIGFFVFDYFQVINADEIFPFLSKKPAIVNQDEESPTEIEKIEIRKSKERLSEEIEEVENIRKSLAMEKEKLEAESEKLEQMKLGIRQKEKEVKEKEEAENSRKNKIKVLANKVANMPPDSAVGMLKNWPDSDIIDVFKQMDKDAEEEGKQTITTYLLTLFTPERRSVITNKWLDSESDKVVDEKISFSSEENKSN
ncbi:MAG: flagellar protein FlbB [Leptospiraceae bacterium]|nr:flagellar protein FlbB [Leptospiraceae bacterium]MCK6380752.1 flagellar protein FlbB [Leptospiraceae bacterium]